MTNILLLHILYELYKICNYYILLNKGSDCLEWNNNILPSIMVYTDV